jgi:type VI secretion system protein VasG
VETLRQSFADLTAGSVEESEEVATAGARPAAAGVPRAAGKGQALAQYTINLTDKAKKGEIDPVLGRDVEIRQMVDILIRRRQNNHSHRRGRGEPTAVVEACLRIAEVTCRRPCAAIHTLDLGLLQAGPACGRVRERLKT